MRIGLGQIDCTLGDIDHNLNTMQGVVREAREAEVDLLVFPELSVTGYALNLIDEDLSLQPFDPKLQALLHEAGNMDVVFGFHEDAGLRTYNSAAYTQSESLLHIHRKLYLPTYGPFEERKHFSPGQKMRAFATRHGTMAMLVCNDAWQPVLPFMAVQDGAQILIIPTNSAEAPTSDGIENTEYWYDITRFYARMYQSYVVFANRVGVENNLRFWGGSQIVAPSGEVVAQAPRYDAALSVADVDLGLVTRSRRRAPLVREARLAMLCREFDRLAHADGDL